MQSPKPTRAQMLLVSTQPLADALLRQLISAGAKASPLDPALLTTEENRALFPNRSAGVVCFVTDPSQDHCIQQVCQASAIDILKIDRELRPQSYPSRLSAANQLLVSLYATSSMQEANQLVAMLAEYKIPALLAIDGELQAAPPPSSSTATFTELLVAERDQPDAYQRLAEHFRAQSPTLEVDQEAEYDLPRPVKNWPRCPGCGKRRLAACPICGTSGTSFPAADPNFVSDENAPAAIICTTCDEPWVPKFLRRCEWCGHDFGEGVEFDLPNHPTLEEEFNHRVTVVLFGMGFLVLIVLAWFRYIVR